MKKISKAALMALGSGLLASMSFAAGPAVDCLNAAVAAGSVAGCEGVSMTTPPVSAGGSSAKKFDFTKGGVPAGASEKAVPAPDKVKAKPTTSEFMKEIEPSGSSGMRASLGKALKSLALPFVMGKELCLLAARQTNKDFGFIAGGGAALLGFGLGAFFGAVIAGMAAIGNIGAAAGSPIKAIGRGFRKLFGGA